MNFFNAINIAGSIASIISYPLLGIPILALVILGSMGRKMTKPIKGLVGVMLVAGFVAYIIDVSDRFGWLTPILNLAPLQDIHDQTFINDRVILDGHSYRHCKFINVTFVVNGGRRFEIMDSEMKTYMISSDRPEINQAIEAFNDLGAFRISVLSSNGKIIPPFGENPEFRPAPQNP